MYVSPKHHIADPDRHAAIISSISVIGLVVYLYVAATSQFILIGIGCVASFTVVALKIARDWDLTIVAALQRRMLHRFGIEKCSCKTADPGWSQFVPGNNYNLPFIINRWIVSTEPRTGNLYRPKNWPDLAGRLSRASKSNKSDLLHAAIPR